MKMNAYNVCPICVMLFKVQEVAKKKKKWGETVTINVISWHTYICFAVLRMTTFSGGGFCVILSNK